MSLFSNLVEAVNKQLNELNYQGFKTKQAGASTLHPKYPERIKQINANGGIKLVLQLPEVWKFKVASGTTQGKSYDVFLRFKNIKELIQQFVPNKQLWKKDLTGINYNLLAPEIFNVVDMEMDCGCKSDLYSGFKFIKSQDKAQFGPPETRSPDIKNPKKLGVVCKHSGDVLERLPMYTSTFGSWLKSFYSKEVDILVKKILDAEEDKVADEVEAGA